MPLCTLCWGTFQNTHAPQAGVGAQEGRETVNCLSRHLVSVLSLTRPGRAQERAGPTAAPRGERPSPDAGQGAASLPLTRTRRPAARRALRDAPLQSPAIVRSRRVPGLPQWPALSLRSTKLPLPEGGCSWEGVSRRDWPHSSPAHGRRPCQGTRAPKRVSPGKWGA